MYFPSSSHLPFVFFTSFLVISLLSPSSASQNSLSRGSSLSVERESDILVSPNKTFSCGFYKVGSNAYSFSIWFSNSIKKTVAWTATRNRPVNGRGSRIEFRRDGSLALVDVDDSVVWSTNTSSTGANTAELLDSGNLVVKDPRGEILWQSFDSPTDTLLPNQPLTRSVRLVSSIAKNSVSPGYYRLSFDDNNVLRLVYDGPEISSVYWPSPDLDVFKNGRTNYNSTRLGVLDEMGKFTSSDGFSFIPSDMGPGIRRRLTMDYDGNLRLYSLNDSSGTWSISWEVFSQLCSVHGLCGKNGICVYTPKPECSCPPDFEMSDPGDWNKGCRRLFDVGCGDPAQLMFVEIPHTDFYGFDVGYNSSVSFEYCRKKCLDDCSCVGFGYRLTGTGVCYPKSALFNGYTSLNFPGSTYLKIPRKPGTPERSVSKWHQLVCNSSEAADATEGYSAVYGEEKGTTKWGYMYGFVSAFGVIEILFIATGWWFVGGTHKTTASLEEGYRMISNQFRKFTYGELKRATSEFGNELGRGGSGVVYKGVLDDKRVVAVKMLLNVNHGEEEFWAEVGVIARINHMNLVRMWGFCSEGPHRLLVYEHVDNGSLAKVLFNGSGLEWSKRFWIAVGTAKGLAYLHHECLEWIIHCDLKPENILLDANFEPKIADFGLAKLSERGRHSSNFSCIRGTKGYMAPEWISNLPVTAKVDVYSYGVVLLELVKGSRVSRWVTDGEEEVKLGQLARLIKGKMERGEDSWMEDLVDSRLNGQFNKKQAEVMVEIALSCMEEERSRRPTMDAVVEILLSSDVELNFPVEKEK